MWRRGTFRSEVSVGEVPQNMRRRLGAATHFETGFYGYDGPGNVGSTGSDYYLYEDLCSFAPCPSTLSLAVEEWPS
jgi:hypothetical protein